MKKALGLIVLLCVVAEGALQAAAEAPAPPKNPNVLFILIDDMGWKDLGCYGSDFYETPHTDALAASGVRFTNAYAANPYCSPTRASILTGQEPGRLRLTKPHGGYPGIELNPKEKTTGPSNRPATDPEVRSRLPDEAITFAEVLKEDGYKTAFMGKWHLGGHPTDKPNIYIPERQGFDVVVGGRHHPAPPPPGYINDKKPWDVDVLRSAPQGSHVCDVLTDEAIKYMESNRENPFLLCLWYYDVHSPHRSKEELRKKYAEKLRPHHIQRSAIYAGEIENLDMNIGRVQQVLKDLGLEENTIVIYTSDNGGNMKKQVEPNTTNTNNSPLRAWKGTNYEGGVRVPLMIRVPGVTKAGTTSDVVTSTVDHFVSLTELLKVSYPEGQVNDGESYVRALKGETYERGPVYSAFFHYTGEGNRPNVSMRQGPWKLYKFYYDGPGQTHRYELYNLEEDIGETRNLADEMPERRDNMLASMEAHVKEAGYLVSRKNPNYKGE